MILYHLQIYIERGIEWSRNCLVILFIRFAYILQQTMDNLNELEQHTFDSDVNLSDNHYVTACEGLSRLGISDETSDEPINLVIHKGRVPFRRTKSAPMTSTPINRLKDFFEEQGKSSSMIEKFEKVTLHDSLMETCKKGLEISNETRRRKKSSEYPTLFTKDDALALRATASKGFLPENNDKGLKLYYQSTMPKQKVKRMGLRL